MTRCLGRVTTTSVTAACLLAAAGILALATTGAGAF